VARVAKRLISAFRGHMPDIGIEAVLAGAGIDWRSAAGGKMFRYVTLLAKWNSRVNLVSSTRPAILTPLIQEALWAAERYPSDSRAHLDIGSGAGFPAIPLAIIRSEVEITMVESRERKAAFLQTVVCDLELGNVQVENQRLDNFLRRSPATGPWDCVSWKAIKLSARDFSRLLAATAEHVRFWMFHGADLPAEDASLIDESLQLNRRDACPFHAGWFLSEFRRKTVSRETG